jgi:hypothetical protein
VSPGVVSGIRSNPWFADDFAATGGVPAFLRANGSAALARTMSTVGSDGRSYRS